MAKPDKPVVLITGTSSGIGLALIKLLLNDKRYRVVATARSTSLEKLEKEGIKESDCLLIRALDVCDSTACKNLIDEVSEKWAGVDILINNAGISYRSVVEHMSEREEEHQLKTNYSGPLALTRLVLPHMRKQRWGRILNVSSVSGMMAMPTMGSYSASKFALEGASESLWYEMRPWNVAVTLIQPGFINSNSFRKVYYSELATRARKEHKDYEAYYTAMESFVEKLMTGASATSESVARTILKTMHRARPPLRVTATADATFFFLLRRLLPRNLYHWALFRNLPQVQSWGAVDED